MEDTFTVAEIRRYILSQDSLGDVLNKLDAENIRKANEIKLEGNIEYREVDGLMFTDDEVENSFT